MRLQSIEAIEKTYGHVYVSPHLDDVVLSCGGRIAMQTRRGESVLIVTVFSRHVDEGRKTKNAALKALMDTGRRRIEDAEAMERMGVDYLWLDYADCIFRCRVPISRYRLRPLARKDESRLFGAVSRDVERICEAAGNGSLYLPLGVGQHVDHQLAFELGTRLGRSAEAQSSQSAEVGFETVYYEDFPYVLFPLAFDYRMRTTGIGVEAATGGNRRRRRRSLEEIRHQYETLIASPTLELNSLLLRPVVYLGLIGLHLWVNILGRGNSGASSARGVTAEIIDVSDVIKEKLDAILVYGSQPGFPLESSVSIEDALATYSATMGGARGTYLERYWR